MHGRGLRHTGGLGLALIAASALVAGCSAATTSSTNQPEVTDMPGFVLTSPSFADGGAIPVEQSCDGVDRSPALHWEGAPTGARSFALIVDDPDARGFIHWVAYDIDGGVSGDLAAGLGPSGPPPQGRNDFGRNGYGGPCPPSGTHHYRFTLYALGAALNLGGTPSASDVRTAVRGSFLAQTTLTGTYTRRR
jgi:Raf kinase inhibitor-like YbhB/YbcL family protein